MIEQDPSPPILQAIVGHSSIVATPDQWSLHRIVPAFHELQMVTTLHGWLGLIRWVPDHGSLSVTTHDGEPSPGGKIFPTFLGYRLVAAC